MPRGDAGADRIPNVVTIAGVDPSGGAGVLADVKAISALGAYACAVIAALTAQNTRAVTGVPASRPSSCGCRSTRCSATCASTR